MAPRLSIVIPALNEATNLARLLPDLIASEPEAEVLVVDGGSDDDSRAVSRACRPCAGCRAHAAGPGR